MKPVEIRDLDAEELLVRVAELKEELFNLRFQMATGQLDNHRRMREVRHDIARIRTVLRQREIEAYYELERMEAAQSAVAASEGSEEESGG